MVATESNRNCYVSVMVFFLIDDQKVSQLESVHQQHVQTNFDAKKRKAIEKLMEELQKSKPSVSSIFKYNI